MTVEQAQQLFPYVEQIHSSRSVGCINPVCRMADTIKVEVTTVSGEPILEITIMSGCGYMVLISR